MELKEAIEVVRNIDTTDIHCKNCVLEEKDKCITDLFGYSCQRIAINTVLEELNNRIPRKKVEELLEEIRKEYFDQINGKDRSLTTKNILTHQYNAMETVLEEILNKE